MGCEDINLYFLFIAGMLGAVALFLFIRNWVVHRARMRAIEETANCCHALVSQGKDYDYMWERFDRVSYDVMIFQVWKWRYRDFYPTLSL
jgi:hypothetical protein